MFSGLTVPAIWAAVTSFGGMAGVSGLVVAVVGYSVFRRVTRWGAKKI